MKAFRNPFLLIVLFCTLFLVKCTCPIEQEDPTLVERISTQWKISELVIDRFPITTGIENFRLTLNKSGKQPTTYTIITGGLALNFAPNTSGNWSLDNNDNPTQIIFSGSTVSLLNASSEQLVLQYTFKDGKVDPVVRFTLVPAL